MVRENQFKDFIKPSTYKKSNNRILKLLRKLDALNLSQQSLLEENIKLKIDLNNLNSSFDNLDDEINNLEVNFKALPKPLIVDLELTKFSTSTIFIINSFIHSLWKNFLTLSNDNKALKWLSQGI